MSAGMGFIDFEVRVMTKVNKQDMVKAIADMLQGSTIAVVTDYRGLSVAQMSQLRSNLRQAGISYRVVKNTLARFAAKEAGDEGLVGMLQGPTAIAFGYGEIVEPARVIAGYISSSRTSLSVKGALLSGRVLSPEEVSSLSMLPSRGMLIARLMGGLQAPIVGLVNVLGANMRGFVTVLNARIQQMEGG